MRHGSVKRCLDKRLIYRADLVLVSGKKPLKKQLTLDRKKYSAPEKPMK